MMSIVLNVLPFLLVLTTLVFIHELGHYLVARRNGVHVEVFSIGFGPEIFGWTDSVGTRWRISLLPLGGYVMMLSDADVSSARSGEKLKQLTQEQRQKALHAKTPWQRIKVAAAGPLANYVFAVFLLWVLMAAYGERTANALPIVGRVAVGSAAEKAGVLAKDTILSINDVGVDKFIQIPLLLERAGTKEVTLRVRRVKTDGTHDVSMRVTPDLREIKADGKSIQVAVLGVLPAVEFVPHSLYSSAQRAVALVVKLSVNSFTAITNMITGRQSTPDLLGPIGIAQTVAELAHTSFYSVLWFMALLSVSLGFINLMPIPMLDGGQILMYIVEAIQGRPLSEKAQTIIGYMGLFIVGGLFLISTSNDVMRFWK